MNMMLLELILNAALLLLMIVMVIGNIIRIIMFFKCAKRTWCDNKGCHLKLFCHTYQMSVTQEDLDQLEELLREKRKELDDEEQG